MANDFERDAGRARLERPLVALALAAAAGQVAGLVGGWTYALVGLAWIGGRGRRLRLAVALAALVAALVADRDAPGAIPRSSAALSEPARGRWQPRSRDRTIGRLVAEGPRVSLAHTVDLELEGAPPHAGEALEILSLGRLRLPASGPVVRRESRPRATVRADAWRRLEPRAPPRLLAGARRFVAQRLVPVERAAGHPGLLQALVLGDVGELPYERRDLFTRTGTRHLLAISGLHAGLVALGLAVLFGRSGRRARPLSVATTLVLIAWALLSGAAPPVRRAALTLSVARLAAWLPPLSRRFGTLGRRTDGRSLLALAFLVELVGDPRAVQSLSVQLSYGATASLLFIAPAWTRVARACLPTFTTPWTSLGANAFERTWRAVADRTVRAFAVSMAASTVASLATLPPLWLTFGEASWVSVPATPLALPGLAGLLFGAFLAIAGLPGAEWLVGAAGDGLVGMLAAFDVWPGTPSLLPLRPGWAVSGVCLSGLALPRLGRWSWVWCAAAVWLLWPRAVRAEGLEIHALDVGAGTAIVVRSPEVDALVFDAGSRDRRAVWDSALAPLLASWEVDEVHVVLSHTDLDHRVALPPLFTRTRIASVAGPIRAGDSTAHWDGDGARFEAGDLELELVRGLEQGGNEGSRSLIVRWRGRSILLSGDAEAEGLAASLERGAFAGPFDLATMPHHGSETRLLGAFLERTDPARVWVSGAADAPILPELERRGLAWEATGRSGPLVLLLPPRDP